MILAPFLKLNMYYRANRTERAARAMMLASMAESRSKSTDVNTANKTYC